MFIHVSRVAAKSCPGPRFPSIILTIIITNPFFVFFPSSNLNPTPYTVYILLLLLLSYDNMCVCVCASAMYGNQMNRKNTVSRSRRRRRRPVTARHFPHRSRRPDEYVFRRDHYACDEHMVLNDCWIVVFIIKSSATRVLGHFFIFYIPTLVSTHVYSGFSYL